MLVRLRHYCVKIKTSRNFDTLSTGMRKASIKAATVSAVYMPVVMTIGSAATAIMLYVGGEQVMDSAILLGELNFFITMSFMFFEPIYQIARIFWRIAVFSGCGRACIRLG